MSGISNNILPVTRDVAPREGSRVCVIPISWQQTNPLGVFNINLTQQYLTGGFTTIQSVFIDNSTCPYSFALTDNQTGETIACAAFSQTMFPLISGASPNYTATLNYVITNPNNFGIYACTSKIYFLNTPSAYITNNLYPVGLNTRIASAPFRNNYLDNPHNLTDLMFNFFENTFANNFFVNSIDVTIFSNDGQSIGNQGTPAPASQNQYYQWQIYEMNIAQNYTGPAQYEGNFIVDCGIAEIASGEYCSQKFSTVFDPPYLSINQPSQSVYGYPGPPYPNNWGLGICFTNSSATNAGWLITVNTSLVTIE